MDDNRTQNEKIEDSIRVCEELLSQNPYFIPERPKFLDELEETEKTDAEPVKTEPQMVFEPVRRITPEKPQVTVDLEHEKKTVSQKTKKKNRGRKGRLRRTLTSFLVCVVIAVITAVLISRFVANHTTVEGNSMKPGLSSGDQLVVEKISYLTGRPQRYDVIVFQYNETIKYIKRVIGLPGETIRIDEEGKIYINDTVVFDEFGSGVIEDPGVAKKDVKLGADEYFVLGDNRNASKDSRNAEVGMVKEDQILGKAWLRVVPWENFGMIK